MMEGRTGEGSGDGEDEVTVLFRLVLEEERAGVAFSLLVAVFLPLLFLGALAAGPSS
jgi:hypothetical protein